MNPEHLIPLANRLLQLRSPEEFVQLLQAHPELLQPATRQALRALAAQVRASGQADAATALEERLTLLDQADSATGPAAPKPPPIPNAGSIPWARLFREHLALRQPERLADALRAAEQAGERDIAALLRAFQQQDFAQVSQLAPGQFRRLSEAGRAEEALTAALADLYLRAGLAEAFNQFPLAQQNQALQAGLDACQEAGRLARQLNDPALEALFHVVRAGGLSSARQLEGARAAFEEALTIRRRLAEARPEVFGQYVATTLNNLGNVLSDLRQLEGARAAFEEALQEYRRLAEARPEVFGQYVAGTLNNLGNVLSDLRQLEGARAAYEEALQEYRRLAEARPEVFGPDVAMTLNNLGNVLSDLRQLEGARAAFEEALTIRRRLAEARPEVFGQYVATTLNNLGTVLRDLRQLEGARAAYEEALQEYRRLAEARPEVFGPDVAMTLNNLGNVLSDLRQLEGARAAFEEALTIRRRLAEARPEVFGQYVATTLNNLGNVLSDLRQLEGARAAYEEALQEYRRLAEARPEVFGPDVAMTLNNLGNVLSDLRQLEGARAAFEEALTIRRRLAEARPEVFGPDVAMTLNNLGTVLRDLRQLEGARAAFEEALTIRRRLAEARPEVFGQYVAGTLNNLGNVLSDLRQLEGARAAYEEALQEYRRLAEARPEVFGQYVAGTLNNLGTVLSDLRQLEGARAAFEEALTIRRRLAEARPEVFGPDVAMTLNNLGTVLRDLRQLEGARAAYEEALTIRRRLAEARPEVFGQYVAGTLNNLGNVLSDLRQLEGARAAYEEALQEYRRLAEARPEVFGQYVAGTLNNLGTVLSDLRQLEGARAAYEEALPLFRQAAQPDRLAITLNNLARLRLEGRDWAGAVELLREAVAQVRLLQRESLNPDRRRQVLRENLSIFERLLLALMRLHRYDEALEVAEEGRSHTLADLLAARELRPRNVPPTTAAAYEAALFKARALADQLRQAGTGERPAGADPEALRRALVAAQGEQQAALREIQRHDPEFLPAARPLRPAGMAAVAGEAGLTVIVLRVTEAGTFAFLQFPDGTREVVEVPAFTTERLGELMVQFDGEEPVGGWVVDYYGSLRDRHQPDWKDRFDRWHATLAATLGTVERELLAPVRQKLAERGLGLDPEQPSPVVLVPNRALAVLPLAAAWWEEDGRRVHWLDRFTVRTAPSVTVFGSAFRRGQQRGRGPQLVGVANPPSARGHSLPFTEWECTEIERIVGDGRCLFLRGPAATRAKLLAEHGRGHRLHLSCHGSYNPREPERSALLLAGADELDLGTILAECQLPDTWLVTLSACETALTDFRDATDESVGLPFGFLYAGSPTVWGTLWAVNDLSTALLMVKAYEELETGRPKAEALRTAQRWLRDVTVAELNAYLEPRRTRLETLGAGDRMGMDAVWRHQRIAFGGQDPQHRPFAHPYHWAGFQNVGA